MISRLVLFSQTLVSADLLLAQLKALELIGDRIERNGETHFLPGPEFLRHIILVGCSPTLALSPEMADGDNLCSLHIPSASEQPQLHVSANPHSPKCPACKNSIQGWRDMAEKWQQQPDHTFPCPQCTEPLTASHVNWQRSAAVTCSRIEILGIYANEGIPSEQLLNALNDCADSDWDFFYC